MKMPRLLRRKRRTTPPLPAWAQTRNAKIIMGGAAGFFLFVVLVRMLGGIIGEPSTGPEVIDAAHRPSAYSYEVQLVRDRCWRESDLAPVACGTKGVTARTTNRQSRTRSANVDTDASAVAMTIFGAFEQTRTILTDGKKTIGRTEDSTSWQRITPPIRVADLTAPNAGDLAGLDPVLVSDTASVRRMRTWEVTFRPDRNLMRKILTPQALGVDEEGAADIRAGRFTPVSGRAWITRDGRDLMQLTVTVRVPGGARIRALVQWWNIGESKVEGLVVP